MNTDLVEAQKIEGVQNQAEAYVTDGYPEKMTLIFGSKNGIVSEKTNLIKKELFSIHLQNLWNIYMEKSYSAVPTISWKNCIF